MRCLKHLTWLTYINGCNDSCSVIDGAVSFIQHLFLPVSLKHIILPSTHLGVFILTRKNWHNSFSLTICMLQTTVCIYYVKTNISISVVSRDISEFISNQEEPRTSGIARAFAARGVLILLKLHVKIINTLTTPSCGKIPPTLLWAMLLQICCYKRRHAKGR